MTGYVAESRVCQIILERFPRQFVRSLEGACFDGALLLDDFFDRDQGSLERHSRLESAPKPAPPFLPIEIKHTVASLSAYEGEDYVWYFFRSQQRKDKRRGVVIVTSAIDPDRVVICPANALLQHARDGGGGDDQLIHVSAGETLPGQTYPPAFPSPLKPYEIPISDLGETLSLLLKCARDGTKEW